MPDGEFDRKSTQTIRAALLEEVINGRLNCMITLSTNKSEISVSDLQRKVYAFQHNIEQKFFRNKARKTDTSFDYQDYFRFYGFFEQGGYGDNKHYHLVAYLDPNYYDNVSAKLDSVWKRIFKNGSSDIQRLDVTPEVAVKYVTKQLSKAVDQYVLSEKSEIKNQTQKRNII